MSRRNYFIRTIAAFTGDFAVGFSMAVACSWLIQYAALGLFLSFLLWLVAIVAALALSQHLVHPLTAALLSDRKLDRGIEMLSSLAGSARELGLSLGPTSWDRVQRRARGFAASFTK